MLIYIPNEEHENLIFFDTEFDHQKLVQVSMILYQRVVIDNIPLYLLKGSVNIYIKRRVSYFFTNHTGITESFLWNRGVDEDSAREELNKFLEGLNHSKTMLVSHGVKQDAMLLLNADIHIHKMDRYCTYNNAKRILNREDNLKLAALCKEAGFFSKEHDAYEDSINVLHVFSNLRLIEYCKEKNNERV